MDENYFMEFEKFIHNEHRVALNAASLSSATDVELRDVVEQSIRVAEEGINENVEDSVSEKGI